MKSYRFLIILLGLINVVFCTELANVTEHDTCPVSLLRQKRALDYTRWRYNMETTPEFIVKVLDEAPVQTPSSVVAVNVMSTTEQVQRIIVGGARVSTPSAADPETVRDYTRFQPPTTVKGKDTLYEKDDFVQPILPGKENIPIDGYYEGRNRNRDESPPARPQFVPRKSGGVEPRPEYPPITPVAFNHPTRSTEPTPGRTSADGPTRSTSRNLLDDLPIFRNYFEKMNKVILSRTTGDDLDRSTIITAGAADITFPDEEDIVKHPFTKNPFDNDGFNKKSNSLNKTGDSDDPDVFLDNYEYKDKDSSSKKSFDFGFEDQPSPKRDNVKKIIKSYFSKKNKAATPQTMDPTTMAPITELREINENQPTEMIPIQGTEVKKPRERRRPICNMIKLRQINYNTPRTLPEIVAQLKQWTESSPLVKLNDVTQGNLTSMENPIYIMTVDDPSVGQVASEKQNVLLIAGIQGRDHYAVASAMFVLYQLIERSESHFDLLSKYRFWIIPVFNPDGYDYTMTFPHRREWMKNLRQTWDICTGREACQQCSQAGLRCAVSPCYGVNLDRNFEYQWISAEELKSEHPCGNLYAGPRQLSEPETQALTNFLHKQQLNIAAFIAFKEGETLGVMYPYSHTKKRRALDAIYRQRAQTAATAASGIANRPYVFGQTSEFLPLFAGGIEDWADGHLGIDNTYSIMMFLASDLSKSDTTAERVIHEAYTAMDSLLLQISKGIEKTASAPLHTLARHPTLSGSLASHSLYPHIIPTISIVFINLLFSRFIY